MAALDSSSAIPGLDYEAVQAQNQQLSALLSSYKVYQKQATRDLSMARPKDLERILRSIEIWVVDTGLSRSGVSSGLGRNGSQAERVGVDAIVEILVTQVGWLVPSAKKKRATMVKGTPTLPTELSDLWMPLLERLDDSFDDFESILLWQCLETLAGTPMPVTSCAYLFPFLPSVDANSYKPYSVRCENSFERPSNREKLPDHPICMGGTSAQSNERRQFGRGGYSLLPAAALTSQPVVR